MQETFVAFSIPKIPKVHYTTGGDCYTRVNTSKKKIKGARVTELGYSKDVEPYEKKIVDDLDISDFLESKALQSHIKRVETLQSPKVFLRKQHLLTKRHEQILLNVGCVLLFDEDA